MPLRFQRTYEELKPIHGYLGQRSLPRFQRTYEELKRARILRRAKADISFQRTYEELKQEGDDNGVRDRNWFSAYL